MENASKALIIVGAILLSILLIGIGMSVITSSQGTLNESLATMSAQEKQAFNAQFENYQGDKISGTQVKSLLSVLATNYSTNIDEPAKVPIITCSYKMLNEITPSNGSGIEKLNAYAKLEYKNVTEDKEAYPIGISDIRNSIRNNHTYAVSMYFGENGVINQISIIDI